MQLSNEEINALKNYLKDRVDHARYYSDDGWHDIGIHNIDILSDGRIAVYVMFDSAAPDYISRIQFVNADGGIFAEGEESINKEAFAEGILYRYTIKITQTAE